MDKKIKTILVTGASGFIGSHLVKALKAQNHIVQAISHDRLKDATALNIIEAMEHIDYIYHLAAYGNMAHQKDEAEIFNGNLVLTWNLLQATKKIPYKAFINVSSSSVLLPYQTIYSATKFANEALCKSFVDEYQKPIITIRPYSVYGPGEADFRFIPKVFHSCLRGSPMVLSPHARHDWIYVDDVISDFIDKAENIDKWSGGISHSGTGESKTNLEIIRAIESITRKKCIYKSVDKLRSYDTDDWVNNEANASMGKISMYDGLRKYYEWYQKQAVKA